MPTEVLRLDGIVDADLRRQWIAFVDGLGVDPNRIRDTLVIMQDGDGYHLHLSLKTLSASGKGDMLDLATNDVVSTPLVIDLGHEQAWPETTAAQLAARKDFSKALVDCRLGAKITRPSWNGNGAFVVYQRGYPNGIPINANTAEATGIAEGTVCIFRPYLMLCCSDGSFVPWQPTVSDVLATDWVTLE